MTEDGPIEPQGASVAQGLRNPDGCVATSADGLSLTGSQTTAITGASSQKRALARCMPRVCTVCLWGFLMVATAWSSTACILPPERLPPPAPPFPPRVEVGSLRPIEALLRTRPNCGLIQMEVNDIVDFDTRRLLTRWVVNNNLPSTTLLEEEELPLLEPGTPQKASWRLSVEDDLDVDGVEGIENGETVLLSFFVTDAPRYSARAPEPGAGGGQALDLGAIEPEAGASVEVRWTFVFSPLGDCTF